MKKPSKSTLTRKLDKICSELVRARGQCWKCKGTTTLQTAHIFSRKYRSVRWDLDNLLCSCAKCHFWGHANPILFTEFVREYLGEVKYTLLKKIAQPIKQWTIEEMLELYEGLKKLRGG